VPPCRTSGRSSVSFSVLSSFHLLTHPAEVGTDLSSKALQLASMHSRYSVRPVRQAHPPHRTNHLGGLGQHIPSAINPAITIYPGCLLDSERRVGVGVESESHSDRRVYGRSLGGQAPPSPSWSNIGLTLLVSQALSSERRLRAQYWPPATYGLTIFLGSTIRSKSAAET